LKHFESSVKIFQFLILYIWVHLIQVALNSELMGFMLVPHLYGITQTLSRISQIVCILVNIDAQHIPSSQCNSNPQECLRIESTFDHNISLPSYATSCSLQIVYDFPFLRAVFALFLGATTATNNGYLSIWMRQWLIKLGS